MLDALRGKLSAGRPWLAMAVVISALAAAPAPAAAQQPVPTSAGAIDGPSADIPSPSGLAISVARDGTGGLVYLKQVSGVAHVFVSVIEGGSFQPPVEVDSSLGGASSQPVIAAGDGGLLLVGFINGGELYVVGRASQSVQLGAPTGLAGGAINPAISMSDFGKAYLAFTLAAGSGDDVRAAYYYNGRWALESPPLNSVPGDDAGTGSGGPQVATAGDGVGIVAWGENGHIFSRRVWATSASVVDEQADAPPSGCTEASAGDPVVGTEGDSSYAQVAFQETVTCNSHQQSRVLMNRLHGSVYDGLEAPDGLSDSSSDGAIDPQITMGEYGHGWVTSVRIGAHDIYATALGDNGTPVGSAQVNGLPNSASPDPVPATAGLFSNFIAWQQDPGSAGVPEIRVRYAPAGGTLGPETVVSSPAQGPTDAADGIAGDGDVAGDVAVAWLQGTPGALTVMADQMYQPPGPIFMKGLLYENTSYPVLKWTPSHEPWGPMSYKVTLDGTLVAQTQSSAVRTAAAVPDGPHRWQVTGANPAGQSTTSGTATVFVDTTPPTATMTLYGRRVVGTTLHVYVTYVDLPQAGEPSADASGVKNVVLRWGDGKTVPLKLGLHRSFHAYKRTGHYVISLLVTDRAGNSTREIIPVVVKPKPKPKHKKAKKPGSRGTGTSKGVGNGTSKTGGAGT